ncbi:MAG: class I SAM-dependent methyltransferase, partial [Pirellulaceae bacterium]
MVRVARTASVVRLAISLFLALVASASVLRAADTPDQIAERDLARTILKAAGVKGGLVVHLGCGNGKLTAALYASESYLVHGLDADPSKVSAARDYIHSRSLYGKVSVQLWRGDKLPYADNLVRLLVAEDLGRLGMEEVLRV